MSLIRSVAVCRSRLSLAPHHRVWGIRLQHKIAETEVPIVSFPTSPNMDGMTIPKIPVDQDRPLAASIPSHPEPKISFGLDASVFRKMPPTLKKFALPDKVCVVTGGARGLGFNIARGLAEVGAKSIAILDVNQELGDAAAAELYQSCHVPVSFYKVDVRDEKAVAAVMNHIADVHGAVDVVVNSAGIADSNIKAEDYDAAQFRRLVDINLTGSFLVAQASARRMICAGTAGSIIFIASMSGSIVNYPQEQSCYNASKAGVIQLGKSLAAEWARFGIRCNCISPGYMDTELNRVPALEAQKKIWVSMTPQARLGAVDELNGLAVFLASDASSYMTGANCVIDGGYSLY
ncbi:MAG: hypothetical protein M1826_006198 [Phylliscum demangeonii]|nr:MAG: hypothetical protein M1826_006198 [Phylliscum demangeonii]